MVIELEEVEGFQKRRKSGVKIPCDWNCFVCEFLDSNWKILKGNICSNWAVGKEDEVLWVLPNVDKTNSQFIFE